MDPPRGLTYFTPAAVRPDTLRRCGACGSRSCWATLTLALAVPLHLAATMTAAAIRPPTPAFLAVRSQYAGAVAGSGINVTRAEVWSTEGNLIEVQQCNLPVSTSFPYRALGSAYGRASGVDAPGLGSEACVSVLSTAKSLGPGAGYLDVARIGISPDLLAAVGNAAFGVFAGVVATVGMIMHFPVLCCCRAVRASILINKTKRAAFFVATLGFAIASVAGFWGALVAYDVGIERPARQYWWARGERMERSWEDFGTLPASDPAALYTLFPSRGFALALGAGITDTIALILFFLYGVSCRFGACPADERWVQAVSLTSGGDAAAVLRTGGMPSAVLPHEGTGAPAPPAYAYTADGAPVPVAAFAQQPQQPQQMLPMHPMPQMLPGTQQQTQQYVPPHAGGFAPYVNAGGPPGGANPAYGVNVPGAPGQLPPYPLPHLFNAGAAQGAPPQVYAGAAPSYAPAQPGDGGAYPPTMGAMAGGLPPKTL